MSLQLYDTATRAVREFVPVTPGRVGMYLCGVTVQARPHIGHLRSAVAFDILWRWLERAGFAVTYVRNVTDIDDKVLIKSAAAGVEWWAWAAAHERDLAEAYALLGCRPPTVEPRATGHITEMVTLIERLIARGHAYTAGSDVYFDVASWPSYGALSGQRPDALQAAPDGDLRAKRDPRDFALWKAHKPTEPDTAAWPAPWGAGRPGWHLECSAMARRYLGPAFDIHGGGVDLVFPHHENELAQSAAAGDAFAGYWLHNGWVTLGGEKMSKSLGNTLSVAEVTRHVRPVELRYYLAAAHYRSMIEYTEEALAEAAVAYRRVEGFVRRATERVGEVAAAEPPAEFVAAMDDDLGVPAALAALHQAVHTGNSALTDGDDPTVRRSLGAVRAMLDVLGLDPLAEPWASASGDPARGVVDSLVRVVLDQRQAARARRDYATADLIRDDLKRAGVILEDTPAGTRWSLAEGEH